MDRSCLGAGRRNLSPSSFCLFSSYSSISLLSLLQGLLVVSNTYVGWDPMDLYLFPLCAEGVGCFYYVYQD